MTRSLIEFTDKGKKKYLPLIRHTQPDEKLRHISVYAAIEQYF